MKKNRFKNLFKQQRQKFSLSDDAYLLKVSQDAAPTLWVHFRKKFGANEYYLKNTHVKACVFYRKNALIMIEDFNNRKFTDGAAKMELVHATNAPRINFKL